MFRWLRAIMKAVRSHEELLNRVHAVERDNHLLRRQIKACMGIDEEWYGWGKIIIMMSLKSGDRVKIIDVKKEVPTTDYFALCRRLEEQYGTPAKYADTSGMSSRAWFGYFHEGT